MTLLNPERGLPNYDCDQATPSQLNLEIDATFLVAHDQSSRSANSAALRGGRGRVILVWWHLSPVGTIASKE